MNIGCILEKLKLNLMIEHNEDDALLLSFIVSAVSYAEAFQHLDDGYYQENSMSAVTEQGIVMLASHFYESRDGSTAGFFGDSIEAGNNVWRTVNRLLMMDRMWKV